ncbi:MAG: M18 family aminopeptidase [Acidimicrobiia bacterium]|nr:M18 family aminopeptidase [Acidimicrobiia bacterium]
MTDSRSEPATNDPLDLTGPTGIDRRSSAFVDGVLADIGASPTPYHAVERASELLAGAGFVAVDPGNELSRRPGRYLTASGGTLIAWVQPDRRPDAGFVVVGAHTDSPNFRVKSHPDVISAGLAQIGLEVYGGVLLNSWLNRDLGLAGRVSVQSESGAIEQVLIDFDEPLLTIPQLAIHLDREISSNGLDLNKQEHLTPMWTLAQSNGEPGEETGLRSFVSDRIGVDSGRILAWDLMPYDLQSPARLGLDREFIASARIDNLLSSFCATRALAGLADGGGHEAASATPVLVLYDHEEIGSESATGAAGNLLLSMLERIAYAQGADRNGFLTAMARSIAVSADGAHATHPNYVDKHDPNHQVALNAGIVIKRNANQRYATDALSESFMVDVCRSASVPLQFYIHRNDLPCGSTIGPITAARLGVSTVDLGAPQLAMHSIRETAGTVDAVYLADALRGAWAADRG